MAITPFYQQFKDKISSKKGESYISVKYIYLINKYIQQKEWSRETDSSRTLDQLS